MCLPTRPFQTLKEWEYLSKDYSYSLKVAVTQPFQHGSLCGYVRVPPGHPAFGKNYHDVDVQCHGGLTFAEPEPCVHEDGAGWWLGFDFGHAGDGLYDPSVPENELSEPWKTLRNRSPHPIPFGMYDPFGGHYWTLPEVVKETEELAEQLANMQGLAGAGQV